MNSLLIKYLKTLFERKEPVKPVVSLFLAGLGGMLAIGTIAMLSKQTGSVLLMAPFGATCVLLFSVPDSPLSQPANVMGGHIVSTTVGLLALTLLPVDWWSMAFAVGMAIATMAALRVTHPPAGADPLVVMLAAPGWDYLLFPVTLGSLVLIVIARLFRHVATILPRTE